MAAQTPVPGCVRHSGWRFLYVCFDCKEELICAKCLVDTHNGHKIALIDDVVSKKIAEIQQYMDRLSNVDNAELQENITLTEGKIKKNGKTFRAMIADIKDQAQKMKQETDKFADNLIQLCGELQKSNEEMLKSYKLALERLKDENNRRIEDCQEILKKGTIMELMVKAKETQNFDVIHPVCGRIKNVQFKPGHISVSQLYNSLGFVTIDGIIKTSVVSKFTHKSFISLCRTTHDNNAWLSHFEDNDIHRVDQAGEIKEIIQCKAKVWSTAISPTTGRVWFCCGDDRTVREVIDGTTIITRFVTDSIPRSLCITTNNTIVVGMVQKIMMYTTQGQEVKSDGVGGQDVRNPCSIAYCTLTGNIVVSDSDNVSFDDYIAGYEPGKHPYIKVMDKHLNVRFRFPSQTTPDVGIHGRCSRGEQGIYPRDVSFDETGNILVADKANKSIILIDGYKGVYIRTVYTDDVIIRSISLQKDGFLWVGMEQKKVKILKYK